MALPDMQRLVALAKELGRKDRDHAKLGPLLRPPPDPAGPPPGAAGPPPTEQGTGVPLQMPPGPGRLPPERAMAAGRLPPGSGGPPPGRDMAAGGLPPGSGGPPPGRDMAAGGLPPGIAIGGETGKDNLNDLLFARPSKAKETLKRLADRSGVTRPLSYREVIEESNQVADLGLRSQMGIIPSATGGGLLDLAAGGEFSGRVPGEGGGMEDNVRMPIKEGNKQVATLAVSPTEYVVDSHTMAALGNGNPDEGADVMDEAVKQIRRKAYGTNKQPTEISGLAALKPLVDKVG